jgi:hypothetical protein
MSKDKACISAVKEVCQRCHLYKENCGMLDFPDQCSISGRYIEGYHQAEKDIELTWEDMRIILDAENDILRECNSQKELVIKTYPKGEDYYGEILKRFNDLKK